MNKFRVCGVVFQAVLILVLAGGVAQAAINWGNGTTSGPHNGVFSWNTGVWDGADAGAFGSPTVSPIGFSYVNEFGDMDYRVDVGESLNSITRVTINTEASPALQLIRVVEGGSWAGDNSKITVQPSWDILKFSPGIPGSTGPLDMSPSVVFNPDGTWIAQYTLLPGDATPLNQDTSLGWGTGILTVTNIVGVAGDASGDTFLDKEYMHVIFPEPTSVLLWVGLGSVLIRRRRRC